MSGHKALILAAALGILAVQPAAAQQRQGRQGPPPGEAGEGRGGRGPGRGAPPDVMALQGLFDSYVLMQAQNQLQLSPDQAPQFILRLQALQDARRRGQARKGRIIQQLRQQTGQRPDGREDGQVDEIQRLLNELKTADVQSAGEAEQALANLDQVLSVRQRARFRILEEQMERNKLDILMRARRGAPPPQL